MTERPPVASLPMYDWPEVQWAHDALWSAVAMRLRARGIDAPDRLERDRRAEEVWLDPGLVLSQTCGWPYVTRLAGKVRLVATPVYDVEGCEGPLYSSVIVTRRGERGDDLREFCGRRFAVNGRDSLSGFVALAAAMKEAGLAPADAVWVETGSHRKSVRAVAEGRADLAAIDAVCWELAKRFEREAAAKLRVLGRTPLRPGLPLITAGTGADAERAALRTALAEVLAEPGTREARAALALSGTVPLGEADYRALAALA